MHRYESTTNVSASDVGWIPLGFTSKPSPLTVNVGVFDATPEQSFQLTVAKDGKLDREDPFFACTECVFVDAKKGSDDDGDGTAETPWKTIAHAQENADDAVDGAVLRGVFASKDNTQWKAGWSFTGVGLGT